MLEPAFTRNIKVWPLAGSQALSPEPDDPHFLFEHEALLQIDARYAPEQRYVLTAGPMLSEKSLEPLDIARTAPQSRKNKWWGAAVAASCVFHAALALCFLAGDDDVVKIAGPDDAGIALLGNAAENLRAAGDPDETALPMVTSVTLISMLDAKPVESVVAEPVVEAKPVTPMETSTVETPTSKTLTPIEETVEQPEPPIHTASIAEPDLIEPVVEEALPPDAVPEILVVEPAEPMDEADAVQKPADVVVAEPAESVEELAPLPEPSPVPPAKPVEKVEKKQAKKAVRPEPVKHRAEKAAPAREKAPRSSGSGGNAAADTRGGEADAREDGNNGIASKGGATQPVAGNAAISNYPGKVVAKLRRALRYPAQARRAGVRGEVRVSFVVSSAGGVSAVRVVGSSGSPVLDDAAIEAVRRAAPFPAIPDSAGRSSWSFTVPLAFTR